MFIIDKQTLSDLNLLGATGIVSYFDYAISRGGQDRLYGYFGTALKSVDKIMSRQKVIQFLAAEPVDYLFDKYVLFDLDAYLNMSGEPIDKNIVLSIADYVESCFNLRRKRELYFVKRSVCELATHIIALKRFFNSDKPLFEEVFFDLKCDFLSLVEGLNSSELERLTKSKVSSRLVHKYDFLFRAVFRQSMRKLIYLTYDLDALNAVAKGYKLMGFTFPYFFPTMDNTKMLSITQFYHPVLSQPIKNDICIDQDKSLVFLTGANMNGKSTLLRSVGICIYLAHMGFPVPAEHMETRLFDGLLSSINLGDSVQEGYSHFFNEVNRIKFICDTLSKNNNMAIILDELFKGTNYQDACEATNELIYNLQGLNESIFFISSHITEVADTFQHEKHIDFKYMYTSIGEDTVEISYKLKDGVAREKLGMWLLHKNKTFDSLRTKN